MDVGSLVQGDVLALEVRYALQGTVLRHQDGFTVRSGGLITHIDQWGACGLGKDWRSFTGIAEVDRTGVQRFQELRSGWKLRPLDRVAKRLQLRFQKAFVLQEDQRAVLLIADADDLLIRGGRRRYCA
jgi:hypothetical protein